MTKAFLRNIKHLSIWEIGIRWAGYELADIDRDSPPQKVIDIFRSLLVAQIYNALELVDSEGYTSDTIHHKAIPPSSIISIDYFCDENSAQPVFHGSWEELVVEMHTEMISKGNYSSSYLQSIHIFRNELGSWALKNALPFPDFLYSESEKVLILDSFDGVTETSEEKPYKGGMQKKEIDLFWNKLDSGQKARLLAQEIALHLWSKDITLTRTAIVQHDNFNKFIFLSYEGETLKNWIKDVDPRPKTERGGRPSNK